MVVRMALNQKKEPRGSPSYLVRANATSLSRARVGEAQYANAAARHPKRTIDIQTKMQKISAPLPPIPSRPLHLARNRVSTHFRAGVLGLRGSEKCRRRGGPGPCEVEKERGSLSAGGSRL